MIVWLALLALPMSARADWSAFGGNPQHTSTVESSALRPPFKVLWSKVFPVPVGTEETVGTLGTEQIHYPLFERASYPVIGNGEIFVATSDTGGPQHYEIQAFDEYTGRLLWSYADPEYAYDAYLALDGTRLIASGLGESHSLAAFDGATGKLLWSRPGRGKGPVAAVGGVVYFVEAYVGAKLIAASDETGRVLWEAGMFSDPGSGPVPGDGHIYVMGSDFSDSEGHRSPDGYVFDQASGKLLHRFTTEGGLATDGSSWSVVLDGGRLWTSNGGGFNEWNQEDGDIVNAETGVSEGHYVATGFDSIVLDGEEQLGLVEHDGCVDAEESWPGCTFVFRSATLTARDQPGGKPLWSFDGDGRLASGLIRVGHDVFAGSASGQLYAIDDQTGQPIWTMRMPDGFRPQNIEVPGPSGLAADGNVLAVVAGDSLTLLTPASPSDTSSPQEAATVTSAAIAQSSPTTDSVSTGATPATRHVGPQSCTGRGRPHARLLHRHGLLITVTAFCPAGVIASATVSYRERGGRSERGTRVTLARASSRSSGATLELTLRLSPESVHSIERKGATRVILTGPSESSPPVAIRLPAPHGAP